MSCKRVRRVVVRIAASAGEGERELSTNLRGNGRTPKFTVRSLRRYVIAMLIGRN